MLKLRTTVKSIETKDGRVIPPATRIDVLPWPEALNNGWRIAILVDERQGIVKVSEHDLRAHTAPAFL